MENNTQPRGSDSLPGTSHAHCPQTLIPHMPVPIDISAHINLMLMLLIVIIVVNNMFTLSLNVFLFLNACGLYNACMSYVQRGVIDLF